MSRTLLVGISLAAGAVWPAAAAIWYVDGSASQPGDGRSWETAFAAIQRGIDEASDGDTVIVAQGTYRENLRFNGKNIILRSTDPFDPSVAANTIIDAGRSGRGVRFSGTEDETCVLSGFTIRNGFAYDPGKGGSGGGVCGGTQDNRTHARIENNVITGNEASRMESQGGGLAYCDGIIENNVISGNSAYLGGGGLFFCHGTIHNNSISDNSAGSLSGLSLPGP